MLQHENRDNGYRGRGRGGVFRGRGRARGRGEFCKIELLNFARQFLIVFFFSIAAPSNPNHHHI